MIDDLDLLIHDAHVLPVNVFRLIHGPEVIRYFAPDNSVRLYCVFKEPIVLPLVKKRSEHKTNPRKKDVVEIVDSTDDSVKYGHICWVNSEDDSVGIYLYKEKRLETHAYDCLESVFGHGKTRWKIVD